MYSKAQDFLDYLGTHIGLDNLVFNDRSICCLEIPGRLEIQIESVEELPMIVLTAPLGILPEEDREAFYRALLGANFLYRGTTGETLSIDEDTDRIMLCAKFDPEGVSMENSIKIFTRFVETGQCWRHALLSGIQKTHPDSKLEVSSLIPV